MVVVIAIVVIIFYGANAVRSGVYSRQGQAIHTLSQLDEMYLNETENLLHAAAISILQISPENQAALLGQIRDQFPRFSALFLLDVNGRVIVEDTDAQSLLNFDLSGQPYFLHGMQSEHAYFSDPFVSLTTNLVSVTTAHPIYDDNEFQGMLVGEMDLSLIQAAITTVYAGEFATSFIVDHHGILIAHPNQQWVQERRNFADLPIVQSSLKGITQTDTFFDQHQNENVIGSAISMENNWVVVTTEPTRIAFRAVYYIALVSGFSVFIWLALLTWIQLVNVRLLVQPIAALELRAANLVKNPHVPNAQEDMGSFQEIYNLNKSFAKMANEIHDRDHYLEEQIATRTEEVQDKAKELELANEFLHQHAWDLTLINDINSALMDGDSLEEIIKLFAEKTREMYSGSGTTGAAVFLLSDDRQQLVMKNIPVSQDRYERIEKLVGRELPEFRIPLRDGNIHQQVMQGGEPRVFTRMEEIDEWFSDFVNETWIKRDWLLKQTRKLVPQVSKIIGLKSMVAIPLYLRDEPIGLIEISNETSFTQEDLRRNELIANQLAVAIQRARDNEKIRELMEFNETIVQTVPGAIMAHDGDGNFTFANPAAVDLLGFQPEELVGQHWRMITPVDQHEIIFDADNRRKAGVADSYEIELAHKNGSRVPTIIKGSPRLDSNTGKFVGSLVVLTDITELKRAKEDLQQQTIELERSNQDLERFAYISSHDLQEPLRKIQAFGDRLRSKYENSLDERGLDYLLRMQEAARRGQEMVEDLLVYSRVSTRAVAFEFVNINQIVADVLEDLKNSIELSEAKILTGSLPTINADPNQIYQLLHHLIDNAIKFRSPDTTPIIRIMAESDLSDRINFSVQDNGIGFEEHFVEKIFEPFQRLHGRQEFTGSGIGLAICRKIVERHGGAISVSSKLGEGAKFSISFPTRNGRNIKE